MQLPLSAVSGRRKKRFSWLVGRPGLALLWRRRLLPGPVQQIRLALLCPPPHYEYPQKTNKGEVS